jgi:hypothetical protein
MQKITQKETGFGIVGVAIVIAAVLIVGLIAWRVYDAGKSEKATSTQQENLDQKKSSSSEQSNASPAIYLSIQDMGLKLRLSDDIKDLTYSVITLTDGSKAARFSTDTLTKIDSNCDASFGPLGSLEMTTNDTYPTGKKKVVDNVGVFKLDNYYLTYSGPQALCSEAITSQTDKPRAALREAFKTMKLDK